MLDIDIYVSEYDCDISSADAKVKTLVIPTNEEIMIVKDTFNIAINN